MSELIIPNSSVVNSVAIPLPLPRVPVSVRPGTLDDLPFIDALQKKHSKQLGFFPRAQMEGYLKNGWVLVAEERVAGGQWPVASEMRGDSSLSSLATDHRQLATPVGYIASRDRYQKRDELGAVFQLCVSDGMKRGFIGATLLKSVFERASYGCKLFCCWCAQDLEANRFWEAMGFVPLAFRSGSRAKGPKGTARVHIFWQKRIRQGDVTTPWWFPSGTGGGAIREDRIVLPIPPGVRWWDEMPRILPEENPKLEDRNSKQIGNANPIENRTTRTRVPRIANEKAQHSPSPYDIARSKLHFSLPAPAATPKDKPARVKRKATKTDPRMAAAARELRDRWSEQVNSNPAAMITNGKYEVCRSLPDERAMPTPQIVQATPLLPAPIAA